MSIDSFIDQYLPSSALGIVIIFAICISFFEAISQSSMKYYIKNKENRNKLLVCVGIAGYIMVSLLLLTSYRYESMGRMNMVWSCISIITAYTIGFLVFEEYCDEYTVCSIVLALSAIYIGSLAVESKDCGSE